MSGDGGLEDFSLLDLFRSEVETHSEVLSTTLLALERAPDDTSRVDEMMRAAHSIKGAARVVGVDPAVSVAHVMEDCFVSAQKGNLKLSPADVDVLLRGVDLLGKISEATKDPKADLPSLFETPVSTLVVELEAMLAPRPAAAPTPAAPAPAPAPLPAAPPSRPTPSATTITLPACLDAAAAEEIRRQFVAAVEGGCELVRLDLRATRDLDVQGLVLLAALPRHVARAGQPRVETVGVSTEMGTVLAVTGLAQFYGGNSGPTHEGV